MIFCNPRNPHRICNVNSQCPPPFSRDALSTHRNVFARHYTEKASLARSAVLTIFATEALIGSFAVKEALIAYMARVDPHLIFGCEICIDVDTAALSELEEIQVGFLRRLLGLHPRSNRAVLFTETGVMPIKYRRIILALRYLAYIHTLDANHYARSAFEDSKILWREKQPCWLSDLQIVLGRLDPPIALEEQHITDALSVPLLIKQIEESCVLALYNNVNTCSATALLRGRQPSAPPKLRLQPYLRNLLLTAHRKALTQLVTSCHCLASERLKWNVPKGMATPLRKDRLCRLCRAAVEDEKHALFLCKGDIILDQWRSEFLNAIVLPDRTTFFDATDKDDFLRWVIRESEDSCIFALSKLTYKVLTFFDTFEMYRPVLSRVTDMY